jgi:hypothetical protein
MELGEALEGIAKGKGPQRPQKQAAFDFVSNRLSAWVATPA